MNFYQDLRFGFRVLRKSPAFTVSAVCALALGIGANSAVFSLVNGVLLRPLPFPESERLMNVWESDVKQKLPREVVASGNYEDWRVQNNVFASMGAWRRDFFNLLSTETEPERFAGASCDPGFFTTLQVHPLLGRTFDESENEPGHDGVIILSYALWLQRFGGDKQLLGKSLRFQDQLRTVIGVMPKGFEYPAKATAWAPLALSGENKQRRDLHQLRIIARLKNGVSLDRARAEMATIANRLADEYPALDRDSGIVVNSMLDDTVGAIRPALLVLSGAVALVLLIACANVAGLLLAKVSARKREMAIRKSLGAGWSRVVTQIVTESILLSSLGGLVGILWSYAAFRFLVARAPAQLPRVDQVNLDWRPICFTIAVTVLAGIILGLTTAWQTARTDTGSVLKEGSRGSSGENAHRGILVAGQIAIATILLAGAGLLVRSFQQILGVDLGFSPEHLLTLRLVPEQSKYRGKNDLQINLARRILEQASVVPGVKSAAISTDIPLLDDSVYIMRFADHPNISPAEAPLAHTAAVTPDFFAAMGMRLIKGRTFTPNDTASSPPVAIVSQKLVDRYFAGRDPIGKQLEVVFRSPPEWRQIVGVVMDTRSQGLDQDTPVQVYTPYLQRPAMVRAFAPPLTVLVRTAGDPLAVSEPVKQAILAADRSQPVYAIQPMTDVISQSVAQRRLSLFLLAFFAVSALFLAAVGLYGILSYTVTQRTREIGIRMAIGAPRSRVLWSVLSNGMKLVLIGLAIGFVGALLLTRLMTSLLFHVHSYDVLTFAAVAASIILVGVLASAAPALTATRIEPVVALRYD